MDTEKEIVDKAIAQLKAATGLKLKRAEPTLRPRATLLLTLKNGKKNQQFAAQFKKHLDKHSLGAAIHALRHPTNKGLLIADYVNPNMAQRLKDMDIPFLDAVGNAFLNEPPIYVYITGNKPFTKIQPIHGQPFHAAGLRIVFALLCQPRLANRPYREIAQNAQVALGTVGKVMEDLVARRNLIAHGKGNQQLVNTKQLLQEWIILFPTTLRPKLVLGRYTAPTENWWKAAKLPQNAYWGGEIAAAKLTQYLTPAAATIYTRGKATDIVLKNHLRENNNGNIEILNAFWDGRINLERKGIAPALLVYADLLATGDPRNIQAAELLYENELARFIDQN
jgi:hypothetical protein